MQETGQTYYRTLYEVVKVISSSLEPSSVLNKIVEQVTKTLGVKGCTIRLLSKDDKFLLPGAFYGLSTGYIRKGAVEVEKSGLDKDVLAGKVVYIKDASHDPRFQYPQKAEEEGFTSVMVVPLLVEGSRVIGVLRIYSATVREFSGEELDFLSAVADLSAIAIENARMHQALKLEYELQTAYKYQLFDD